MALAVLLAANWGAVSSLVRLWAFSGLDYGFLILAISVWLLWRSRDRLAAATPRPDWRGLPLVVLIGFGSWLAYLVDVQLVQQFLLVGAVGALTWTILGPAVFRIVAFPIAFLFLALPIWNHVDATLQDVTTRGTVLVLQSTGTPVFADQHFINIPNGRIHVMDTCSGKQYFQAGVTLGALYAYLNLSSSWTRGLVLLLFAAASVAGNVLRVYTLVLIGHLTEMQHFLVGWSLFALLLIPLFWLGTRLQRYEERRAGTQPAWHASPVSGVRWGESVAMPRLLTVATFATALLAIGPVAAQWHAKENSQVSPVKTIASFTALPPWSGPAVPSHDWRPVSMGAHASAFGDYRKGEMAVSTYLAFYARQSQGAEVVNELNRVYDGKQWRLWVQDAGTDYAEVRLTGDDRLRVVETRLANADRDRERLVWHWYYVGGRRATTPWYAKWAQLRSLAEGRHDAAAVVVSTEITKDADTARKLLQDFLVVHIHAIEALSVKMANRQLGAIGGPGRVEL